MRLELKIKAAHRDENKLCPERFSISAEKWSGRDLRIKRIRKKLDCGVNNKRNSRCN